MTLDLVEDMRKPHPPERPADREAALGDLPLADPVHTWAAAA